LIRYHAGHKYLFLWVIILLGLSYTTYKNWSLETFYVIAKLEVWPRAFFFIDNLTYWQLKVLLKQGRCWQYIKNILVLWLFTLAYIQEWFHDIV
jgi:hypothetical protein